MALMADAMPQNKDYKNHIKKSAGSEDSWKSVCYGIAIYTGSSPIAFCQLFCVPFFVFIIL